MQKGECKDKVEGEEGREMGGESMHKAWSMREWE